MFNFDSNNLNFDFKAKLLNRSQLTNGKKLHRPMTKLKYSFERSLTRHGLFGYAALILIELYLNLLYFE